jgi:hypothetical protein
MRFRRAAAIEGEVREWIGEHEHLPRRLQPRAKEAFYNTCMAGAREAAHTTFTLLLEAYGPKHPMVRERVAQS